MLNQLDIEIINSLSQNELSVLRYIDAHPAEVMQMSIQELSKCVFSSTATILRLCKKMHLKGFSELKYVLKNQQTLKENQLPATPFISVTPMSLYSDIEKTSRFLDTKALNKVAEYLLSDKKIYLYASGLSSMSLTYMQRVLLALNRQSMFLTSAPLAYQTVGKLTKDDVLIMASSSGSTPPVIRIAQIAKNNNVSLVAITNLNNNPLSQLADINLYTFEENRDYYGTDIKSRVQAFYIVDMIMESYQYHLKLT
jgi:DNA-binding MurR/RpiR family transcriptional regulator